MSNGTGTESTLSLISQQPNCFHIKIYVVFVRKGIKKTTEQKNEPFSLQYSKGCSFVNPNENRRSFACWAVLFLQAISNFFISFTFKIRNFHIFFVRNFPFRSSLDYLLVECNIIEIFHSKWFHQLKAHKFLIFRQAFRLHGLWVRMEK